jgi:hypothetical protein
VINICKSFNKEVPAIFGTLSQPMMIFSSQNIFRNYAFSCFMIYDHIKHVFLVSLSLSLLGFTAQFRPWPPPFYFLEASQQFSFLQGRVVSPTPTLEDQASVFISPRGRVAQLYPEAPGTHFIRLLRHAWLTVGLVLFPGHHTGNFLVTPFKILCMIS